MDFANLTGQDWLVIFGIFVAAAVLAAVLLATWVFFRIRRINLPANADLFTALRATPLAVVILLDVLDLALDFFSAPIAWIILDRLGLKPLRGVSVVESLIPGTQFLPTMTLVWLVARYYHGPSPI